MFVGWRIIERLYFYYLLERAIIFNALSPAKINVFLENLRKLKINNVLKATVTETSINWSLNEIVANLSAERMAISQGNFDAHH